MTRELVDRMRTCAAALTAGSGYTAMALMDAARLLTEAADALDVPEPLGEPMPVLPVQLPPQSPHGVGAPTWGSDLPTVSARPCPACGSVDARVVRRVGRRLSVTCPVCSNVWEYP